MVILKDDMAKESKLWKTPMILFLILALLFPWAPIWNDITPSELISGLLCLILLCCYFVYGYLYTSQYQVTVTNEKIILKTIFRRTEIEFKDVTAYHCKKYGRSQFYQFTVLRNKKKILVYTRYRADMEKILQSMLSQK